MEVDTGSPISLCEEFSAKYVTKTRAKKAKTRASNNMNTNTAKLNWSTLICPLVRCAWFVWRYTLYVLCMVYVLSMCRFYTSVCMYGINDLSNFMCQFYKDRNFIIFSVSQSTFWASKIRAKFGLACAKINCVTIESCRKIAIFFYLLDRPFL